MSSPLRTRGSKMEDETGGTEDEGVENHSMGKSSVLQMSRFVLIARLDPALKEPGLRRARGSIPIDPR